MNFVHSRIRLLDSTYYQKSMNTEVEGQQTTETTAKSLLESPIEKRRRSGTDTLLDHSAVLTPEGSFSKTDSLSAAKKLDLREGMSISILNNCFC